MRLVLVSASTINEIGFFVSNKPIYDIPGYTISLKHTNATNAAGNLNGGYSVAVNSHTYSGVTGDWNMLTCDNPFSWNGTQNIAVQVCWSQVSPTWDPSGQVRTIAATSGYRYRRNDNTGSACGTNPNQTLNTKPQIRFVFETETVWTGAVSTDWFNSANWTADIPNPDMDARIPTGTPNDPSIVGLAQCNNFALEGTINMTASSRLHVYGDYLLDGTLNDNGGVTAFVGLASNVLTNNSTAQFSTLNCESKGGVTMNGNPIEIKTSLGVQKSTLITNNLVTINSDAIATGRIDELITNCFYTLNMTDSWGDGWNGGFLEIFEDGVSIGTYAATDANDTEILSLGNGSTINFVYTAGQFENENAYTLTDPNGTPIFNDGPTPSTGAVFTTTPNCTFTDPISGQVTVERHIDAGETYWRYMSSAVQGATIDQFNDDFATSGYPGSWYPDFGWTSVYSYLEAATPGNGYQACTGITEGLLAGQGWQVWCGDTITGTQPFVFDLVGVPNQGDIIMPVTYTPSGTPSEDGWNLVGNPYASTIDWDSPNWTKTNMANAVYIQNPDNQQYATYVAGASTNGGSRYIPSQQSFWVQATSVLPVLTAREGVKSNVDQGYFKNGNELNPGMTIRIQGVEDFDEAVLRHLEGSVDEFEYLYDAEKLWGGWGSHPQISLINNEFKDLTVHSIDKGNQEWSIPLRVIVFESGDYQLEFENINELNVPCLQIEDLYDGSMYLVEQGVALPFTLSDTTYSPRFVLHLGKNYESSTLMASCHGMADGAISLDLEMASAVDYQITHDGLTTSENNVANPLVIENLESGIYTIEVPSLNNLCNQTVFNVVVLEPSPLVISEEVSDEILGADGTIALSVSGGTPPFEFDWEIGSINSTVANLVAGSYDVQIQDANGCEVHSTVTVNSQLGIGEDNSDFEAFYNRTNSQIVISNLTGLGLNNLVLYNSLGQIIQEFKIGNQSESVIQISGELPIGGYILSDIAAKFSFKFIK